MTAESKRRTSTRWLSPLMLGVMVVNAICFGGLLVLLALGKSSGPVILLTVGVGLSVCGGVAGAIGASRRMAEAKRE
jgi:hypothetical protein